MEVMPNNSPEPTADVSYRSAVAVHVASRLWLSFCVMSIKPFLLLTCLLLASGCVTTSQKDQFVGTWKTKEINIYLRFYADGKAAQWDERPQYTGGAVWAKFHDGTITFHDWDANLMRRGSTLVMQSESGDYVFYRLPHDLEPPKMH